MAGKFISRWFYTALGKGANNGTTQRSIDFDGYAEGLTKIYDELDSKGYDVINIVPINMGQSEEIQSHAGLLGEKKTYVNQVGFSITRGAVVIGKKREN